MTYGVDSPRCADMEWWSNVILHSGWGRGYSVIGGNDNVGRRSKPEFVQRLAQVREIVVGIFYGCERSRSVDARCDFQVAVALIVLSAIRIA